MEQKKILMEYREDATLVDFQQNHEVRQVSFQLP